MDISALSSSSYLDSASAAGDGSAASKASTNVSKDDFLKLLVTQLKNQNPLDPVKNEDFLAQLATFSSLEQLVAIKNGINMLAGITSDDQSTATDTSNQSA